MLGTKGSGMDIVLHGEVEGGFAWLVAWEYLRMRHCSDVRNGPTGGGIENGCREETVCYAPP